MNDLSTLAGLTTALQTSLNPSPRTIARILLDIDQEQTNADHFDRLCSQSEPGSIMERAYSDLFAAADERLATLRTEARRAIEFACGVTLGQIEEAGL